MFGQRKRRLHRKEKVTTFSFRFFMIPASESRPLIRISLKREARKDNVKNFFIFILFCKL